jgi:hypothetical protein
MGLWATMGGFAQTKDAPTPPEVAGHLLADQDVTPRFRQGLAGGNYLAM